MVAQGITEEIEYHHDGDHDDARCKCCPRCLPQIFLSLADHGAPLGIGNFDADPEVGERGEPHHHRTDVHDGSGDERPRDVRQDVHE